MEVKETLAYLYDTLETVTSNNRYIQTLKDTNEALLKNVKDIIKTDNDFRIFIVEKLNDAIDKFDLNRNKEDKQEIENVYKYASSDGESGVSVHKSVNPNGKFIPEKDEWELSSIEVNGDLYKVTVENIKGRRFMNAFMWEPDYYSTDWFKFN